MLLFFKYYLESLQPTTFHTPVIPNVRNSLTSYLRQSRLQHGSYRKLFWTCYIVELDQQYVSIYILDTQLKIKTY